MNFKVVNQVLILFMIILIGVYAKRKNFINEEVSKGLSSILVNITLPLLVVSSFSEKFSSEMLANAGKVFVLSIVINILIILSGVIVFHKFPDSEKNILKFATLFSNCGFMGFPVMESLFGKTAIFYASFFNVTFNLFMFSYGIMLFTNKKDLSDLKRIMVNPVILCTLIGFIMYIFSIKFPQPVSTTINMVGGMTTPISMLIIGAMLSDIKIKEVLFDWKIYLVSFMRLIFAPLITFLLLKLLGIDGLILNVLVVIQAMPAAATAAVFAEQYNGDKELTSKCIFMTTFLSIFTIPLITQLL